MIPTIAHIIRKPDSGGVERVVLNLSQSPVLQEFHHIALCLNSVEGNFVSEFARCNIELVDCVIPAYPSYLPYRFRKLIRPFQKTLFMRKLSNVLLDKRVNLIHTHTPPFLLEQARTILHKRKLPWILTFHIMYQPGDSEIPFSRKAFQLIQWHSSEVIAVSQAVKNKLIEQEFMPQSDVQIVHNGLDKSQLEFSLQVPNLRENLNIPSGALLVGTVARLSPEKRIDILIEAAKLLARAKNDVYFVVIGSGQQERELQSKIVESKLENIVHLIGFQTGVPALMKQLDLFILTSDTEGFPISLLEALGVGLPCVSTRVGGIPEILDETCAVMIDPGNANQLVNAILKLKDLNIRLELAKGSKIRFKQFSFDRCVNHYAVVYKSCLSV